MTSWNSKRLHYSYIDRINGKSYGWIDVEYFNDRWDIDSMLRKLVLKKWKKVGYTGGDIHTVEFLEAE